MDSNDCLIYEEAWFGFNDEILAERFRPFVKDSFYKPNSLSDKWEYYLCLFCANVKNEVAYNTLNKVRKDIMETAVDYAIPFEYNFNCGYSFEDEDLKKKGVF